MIYAVSDLHGCCEKYKKLLDTVHLGGADTLYVLGDVIDRGDGGIDILLDMMPRANGVYRPRVCREDLAKEQPYRHRLRSGFRQPARVYLP